jgi:hypothetical protein
MGVFLRPLVYASAPHGLAYTHQEQLNVDLLTFLET